jgi:hypothetical protein
MTLYFRALIIVYADSGAWTPLGIVVRFLLQYIRVAWTR